MGASFDKTFRFRKIWQTPWYLYSWDGTSYGDNGLPLLQKGKKGYDDARLNQSSENNYNIQLSAILNYNRNFGENHILNATLGVERIKGRGDSYEAYRRYYISTAIDELFAGGQSEINNTGSSYTEARLNYFGRLNYAYKQKYLAEVVWRYQGSYIFEQSNHFGFFPGASLGYVISEEDYFKKTLPFIHFAKIRASWGQTGNDLINAYQYLASYSYNNLMYITNSGATYNQALKEHQEKNLPVLTKEEIQTIEKDISDKIFNDTEGKYKDIEVISIEVDEKNNLVDVCLKENTKENQKKFKEKVNNSEYIIFTSKRDPHVEAN